MSSRPAAWASRSHGFSPLPKSSTCPVFWQVLKKMEVRRILGVVMSRCWPSGSPPIIHSAIFATAVLVAAASEIRLSPPVRKFTFLNQVSFVSEPNIAGVMTDSMQASTAFLASSAVLRRPSMTSTPHSRSEGGIHASIRFFAAVSTR